jgi:hypothetical protein
MEWSDLAPLVADVAPTLGRLLGSSLPIPFGGPVGAAVGQAIAAAIGAAADPDSVARTLAATPADVRAAQLADAENTARAKWQALAQITVAEAGADAAVGTAQVESVSRTIQSELTAGSWLQKSWRPLAMYVWIASWPVQLGAILWHLGTKSPETINQLSGMVTALTAWNAGPASLAGVYAWGRTREKIATGEQNGETT